MAWFNDKHLKEIYELGITRGISSEDCFIIRRKLAILMATRSQTTHWVAGRVLNSSGARRVVQVAPRWAVSFEWIEDVGPFSMQLEMLTENR